MLTNVENATIVWRLLLTVETLDGGSVGILLVFFAAILGSMTKLVTTVAKWEATIDRLTSI